MIHNSSALIRLRVPVWLICLSSLLAWCGARAGDVDVVINEIMYHPPGGRDNLQYIELLNRGGSDVNLSKWAFTKGVKYTFPDGTRLPGGGYLVICKDLSAFSDQYGQGIRALGNFTGKLSHKPERLELANAQGQRVDSVKYLDGDAWPRGAGGYSSSLERISPFAESDVAANWAASNWPVTKTPAGTPGRQNDNYSTNLPPQVEAVEMVPKAPSPGEPVKVTAKVADTSGLKGATLLYRLAGPGHESEEKSVPMTRLSGDEHAGVYEATIEAQPPGQLVRFRIKATGSSGAERLAPSANEPRPAYSYFAFTNTVHATVPQAFAVNIGRIDRGPPHNQPNPVRRPLALRGKGAFLYVPADGGPPETYDYVHLRTRSGGYKVHFQKDRPLKGLTGINLIVEGPLRWILAEPLSYVLYQKAGVPCPITDHVRLSMDGRLLGVHLLIEQPNKEFLLRNGLDDSGNLYKLIWYGQGIVGQHEKKTNPHGSYSDLTELIAGLNRTSGAAQWAFIEQHFNVEECINYYAVNMCIQNWDGFFNNYFAYHDTGKTGKWEIYPWDEDKTWGDYDGASSRYDWYEMPLTFGMKGDRSSNDTARYGTGFFGGVSWWRPPGYFSGPLLANPEFRKRFLALVQELCATVFTTQSLYPAIDAMEKRLTPEITVRAKVLHEDPKQALEEFSDDMESFREQVQNRRKFLLKQLSAAH
jgi:spore coat protein H